MAHEIYVANGKAAMAFCGALPWHGLGQRLDPASTIEQWAQAAGFDWTVQRKPVFFRNDAGEWVEFKNQEVLYRSDTQAPLSVVSNMFKPLQPAEILEFFRDIANVGGMRLHTAGILQGGRKMWAMARNGLSDEVVPGDQVRGNLLLATAADGTLATTATLTNVRVVCANTLSQALGRTGKKNAVTVNHRSVFNAEAVKSELGNIDEAFGNFIADMRALALKQFSPEQAKELLMTLFAKPSQTQEPAPAPAIRSMPEVNAAPAASTPSPEATQANAAIEFASLLARPAKTEDTVITPELIAEDNRAKRDPRAVAKVLDLFNGRAYGASHEGVHGTGWGLLNAVTQYVDHDLGRTADSRITSAWFGRGDQIKNDARALLQAA